MNLIHIEQFKVMASIGCEPFEKTIHQPLFFDIQFEADSQKAADSDALQDTIDYTKICQTIDEMVAKQHYQLIETLLHTVADTLIKNFSLKNLTLKLSKPTAIKQAKNVAVSLHRTS